MPKNLDCKEINWVYLRPLGEHVKVELERAEEAVNMSQVTKVQRHSFHPQLIETRPVEAVAETLCLKELLQSLID